MELVESEFHRESDVQEEQLEINDQSQKGAEETDQADLRGYRLARDRTGGK